MVLQNFECMQKDNIQIALLRLTDGSRLLRLSEPRTGLALERSVNPSRPVPSQKQKLKTLFEAMLQSSKVLVEG